MMGTTTKARRMDAAGALEWRDGHRLDPTRYPEPIAEQAGAWVSTVGGVEVAVRWRPSIWSVAVGGEDVPYGFALGLREATALVETAARSCVPPRRRARPVVAVEAALRAEVERRGREAVVARAVSRALEAVSDVGDHLDDASGSRPAGFARALRIVLAEAARRGFVASARGEVVETWRARARGRWLDEDEVATGRPASSACGAVVRVERGHVLEVYPADALDDAVTDPEGTEWCVRIDGTLVASVVGRTASLAFAVERAREASS